MAIVYVVTIAAVDLVYYLFYRVFNLPSSKIVQHANNKGHEFNFNETKIVDREKDWHKRLFLEAWHSELDENSENDHIAIPKLYKIIVNSKTARA